MATVHPFPMALYHPFMLWRQFILSLWILIIHSSYDESLSFPYGFYHPFMLCRQFILSLWLFIILPCYGDSLSFPYGSLSSFYVMATVHLFPMVLYLFIIHLCYSDKLSLPYGCLSSFHVMATFLYRSLSTIHVKATVYPMVVNHPFMLWQQFILSLWLYIIHSFYGGKFNLSL
jgi:hypothetical protein